jgi:predicted transcriptional regulator of viral defense system
MPKRQTIPSSQQAHRQAFLACLNGKLGRSTFQWPTARCWTKTSFNNLCREIREELSASGLTFRESAKSLVAWLLEIGIAQRILAEGEIFYIFDVGLNSSIEIDPHELLMARMPSGVICYFSALSYFDLTTQVVQHYHIAELATPVPGHAEESTKPKDPQNLEKPKPQRRNAERKREKLGTLLFRYNSTPFYWTRRSARLVPGIQMRSHGPRAQIRITTLEQTLIDTLYKPFHCGGPEVIFEAWREGLASGRVDQVILADYLTRMQYPASARRLAALLNILGVPPGKDLASVLEKFRQAIDPTNPFVRISLLPGVRYQELNRQWQVDTP